MREQEPRPELIQQYKTFHLAHQYDGISKEWKFKGYTCVQCNRTVLNPNIVPKHFENCKYKKPTIYMQEPEPNQIKTVSGAIWKPFDVITYKTTKHSLK